ncbi:MAG: hypothetical protein IJH39_00100 [Clostridia bacterium]|nr:hypothetical protein [Clostridia bacterium]
MENNKKNNKALIIVIIISVILIISIFAIVAVAIFAAFGLKMLTEETGDISVDNSKVANILNEKNKKDEFSDVYGGWEYNSYYVFNSDGTYRWYKSSDNLKDNYYEGKMEILKGDDAIQELGIKYSQVLTVMSNSKGNVNLNDIYCIKLHPTYLISGGVNKTSTLTDEFDMKLLFVYVNDKEAQAYNYATQDTLYLHKK